MRGAPTSNGERAAAHCPPVLWSGSSTSVHALGAVPSPPLREVEGVVVGDDAVGERLEGVLHREGRERRRGAEGLGDVLLAEHVVEDELERAAEVRGGARVGGGAHGRGAAADGAEVHDGGLVDGAVGVVVEEGVDAVLAPLERAVRAVVDGVALAGRGCLAVLGVRDADAVGAEVELEDAGRGRRGG